MNPHHAPDPKIVFPLGADTRPIKRTLEYQRCPVCEGRGHLPQGFYLTKNFGIGTYNSTEECRTCWGRGIIERPKGEA